METVTNQVKIECANLNNTYVLKNDMVIGDVIAGVDVCAAFKTLCMIADLSSHRSETRTNRSPQQQHHHSSQSLYPSSITHHSH
jgi:hypothetical protein